MNINILDYSTEEVLFTIEEASAAQVSAYANAKYVKIDSKELKIETTIVESNTNTLILLGIEV